MASAVLLIDDNAVQAAVRQTILRRAGHNVLTALSAERVLERMLAEDSAEPIGLIVTDHVMPGMSGAAFVRQLRRSQLTLPVLVISGMEEAETEYVGLSVVFRVKPLLPEELLRLVEELLRSKPNSQV